MKFESFMSKALQEDATDVHLEAGLPDDVFPLL